MLRDMSELSEAIYQTAVRHIADQKWFLQKTGEANRRFNMPLDVASDYLNGNRRAKDDDWFTGFVLASMVDKALVAKYFTPMEISQYKTQKFESRTLSKIRLPMLQVAKDQWIGATTFQYLMQIEDSHLMCYNENTQRVPRARRKSDGGVTYEPYVSRKSVKEIAAAFKRGDFIPNTITFNVREPNEFVYEDGFFIMEKFPKGQPIFDIIDGYHRYRAMRQIYISDPGFDYQMELRIVSFSTEKARQFVYQESLRNKMRKVDAASFDQNSHENQIIDDLNETAPFRNMFTGADAKIDRAVMAAAMRCNYFRTADTRTRERKVEVKKILLQKGRLLEEEEPELFERKWTAEDIAAFILCPDNGDDILAETHRIKRIAAYNNLLTRKGTVESDIRILIKKKEQQNV